MVSFVEWVREVYKGAVYGLTIENMPRAYALYRAGLKEEQR